MLTAKIGAVLARPLDALVRALAHISPDVLTITGLVLNGVACAFFALAGGPGYVSPAMLRVGGLVALAGAIFDMLDGRVARLRGRETRFGAYLDSTMDRYSDMLLYLGLMILYARLGETLLMVLVWVAAFGSFMTSYARARAESLIPQCRVGLMERPERVVLLIAGRGAEQDGAGALDHRGALERHRDPAGGLHLRRAEAGLEQRVRAAPRPKGRRGVSFGPKAERPAPARC